MVEAGLEHRRGAPVELGRAEDDDRSGRPGLVTGTLLPDPERRIRRQRAEP